MRRNIINIGPWMSPNAPDSADLSCHMRLEQCMPHEVLIWRPNKRLRFMPPNEIWLAKNEPRLIIATRMCSSIAMEMILQGMRDLRKRKVSILRIGEHWSSNHLSWMWMPNGRLWVLGTKFEIETWLVRSPWSILYLLLYRVIIVGPIFLILVLESEVIDMPGTPTIVEACNKCIKVRQNIMKIL